jgi:hypothetical protein
MFLKKKSNNAIGFCSDPVLKPDNTLERNLNNAAKFDKKFFNIEK